MSRREKRRAALADAFLETYVCWREACDEVHAAYRRWVDSKPPQRILWFAAYRAALDREEEAASAHSHMAARQGALAW